MGSEEQGSKPQGSVALGHHPVTLASGPLSPFFFLSSTFNYSLFRSDTGTRLQDSLSTFEIVQNLINNTCAFFSIAFSGFSKNAVKVNINVSRFFEVFLRAVTHQPQLASC